ncbi:hypothetical protein AMATHDRAFT_55922 [Amanita thiersii Skay4041]|uniref:IMD domain-containing protein n=1 Tax=Amanita thiersii Skay4041 TaxID=703135 RepID=A0A2A9NYT3_9AGAR|nr:hypothetical protein AMATHDRAFT_55922 [Amanita thiersii Skay4041]
MTTIPSGPPLLAERADIHKSCKSLESLLNILSDYCEVLNAMAVLEKKLAKALRETAGLKVTGDIAANALSTSGNIFETLAEISSKFAKVADKEYHGISTEVKKWFKKLAKEEKAHDERLLNANARIKQATQAYEKKSKKNTRDAAEEHARYINLISTLGPEISQDKYNHALSATQRHVTTTYSVAACLSRLADGEWLRTCETIRRCSPNIGPLGEWRSLCEGGWQGPVPQELPDIDTPQTDRDPIQSAPTGTEGVLNHSRQDFGRQETDHGSSIPETDTSQRPSPAQSRYSPSASPAQQSSTYGSVSSSSGGGRDFPRSGTVPISLEPPRPLVDPNTGSVRSLSAFPTPPTHFPIPPPRSVTFQPASSHLNPGASRTDRGEEQRASTSSNGPEESPTIPASRNAVTFDENAYGQGRENRASPEVGTKPRGDVTEFGVSENTASSVVAAIKHRYTNSTGKTSPPPKDIPRLPTSVIDLASRYQSPAAPPSPSRFRRPSFSLRRQSKDTTSGVQSNEKTSVERNILEQTKQTAESLDNEAPRHADFVEKERQLLQRERELALRAQEIEWEREELMRVRQDSMPNSNKNPSGLETLISSQQPVQHTRERRISFRRQRQVEVLLPLTQQRQLHKDPESPSAQHSYQSNHNASQSGLAPLTTTPSSSTQQHLPPQQESPLEDPRLLLQHSNSSYSLPPSPSNARGGAPELRYNDPDVVSSSGGSNRHAPYCGCDRCSASKYSDPPNPAPSPHALRPPEEPLNLRSEFPITKGAGAGTGAGRTTTTTVPTATTTEKPKGSWMRRLSMPVVMGLDHSSKKEKHQNQRESSTSSNSGRYALGAGVGNTPPVQRGLFSLDGKKNASVTNLKLSAAGHSGNGAGIVREDGRLHGKRSYDAGGMVAANRSMTNLGLGLGGGKR